LENALNNALIYASTQFTANDALYQNRIEHKERVKLRFLENIQKANLGIELKALDVQTMAPMFVKEAFEQVTQTEQEVSQMRNEAIGDAAEMVRRAEGEAQAILNDAQAQSSLITSSLAAQASGFQKQLAHYEADPEFFRKRKIIERMGMILENAQDTWLLPGIEGGKVQELRLQLNREPTLTGGGNETDSEE